jgi:hypothetical protein
MKNISAMSVEDIKALPVGEVVASLSKRESDYASFYFENTVIMANSDGSMTVSLMRTDQFDVGLTLKVTASGPDGASFEMQSPSTRPALVEVAQARATSANFADLAAGILEHLAERAPDLVRERSHRIETVLRTLD